MTSADLVSEFQLSPSTRSTPPSPFLSASQPLVRVVVNENIRSLPLKKVTIDAMIRMV